ncbi:hypothetical protein J1614_000704 [Plenodomus biglobosus]|nr:hypothetical protein J1614_000704 [Plenodomus biglobosus]
MSPTIHIMRHGESLHNIQRNYPHPDPPLSPRGHGATKALHLPFTPSLILLSPMTRTIQTALALFPSLLLPPSPNSSLKPTPRVEIWPDLRETYPAPCNRGVARRTLQTAFPQLDLAECHEEWDYEGHSVAEAVGRAERVRARVKGLAGEGEHVLIVTHRGFAEYLVKGKRFGLGERRAYRFASAEEVGDEDVRMGIGCETGLEMDFGPTVLVRVGGDGVGDGVVG